MIRHSEISEFIRSHLWDDHEIYFTDVESVKEKPPYPFVSHKFTSPYIEQAHGPNIAFDGAKEIETHTTQPTMTISFTVYSTDRDECLDAAISFRNWVSFLLPRYLEDERLDVVIVNVEQVQDRTVFIETEYEFRHGFDVMLRTTNSIQRQTDRIDYVEINDRVISIKGE
ncbi:hypothetical protein F9U64_01185 [Gracilibacillus oryzae]|uniref:Phage neck terminator protein gp12-like domain-containing protein n=1 Tax=Gracilibacillus oryzae TaxID=1672701 RepID=A0A7C8GVV4_9BACI|nr:hypothetical protein [Gracilibacillus oryzae]KAB8139267.1 hypothetical protein F9U64_01185 [Gracilibacillus oryzae]